MFNCCSKDKNIEISQIIINESQISNILIPENLDLLNNLLYIIKKIILKLKCLKFESIKIINENLISHFNNIKKSIKYLLLQYIKRETINYILEIDFLYFNDNYLNNISLFENIITYEYLIYINHIIKLLKLLGNI